MTIEITQLPAEVEAFLQARAAEEGETVSEYVRSLLLREAGKQIESRSARESSRGALSHLNAKISMDDIKEVRKEMWQNFPRDIEKE